jgi:hypothetical protein
MITSLIDNKFIDIILLPLLTSILGGLIVYALTNASSESKKKNYTAPIIWMIIIFIIMLFYSYHPIINKAIEKSHIGNDIQESAPKDTKPPIPNQTHTQSVNTNQPTNGYSVPAKFITATEQARNKFIKFNKYSEDDIYFKINLKEGQGITVALKPQINDGYMGLYLYDKNENKLDYEGGIRNGEYGAIDFEAANDMTLYAEISGETGIFYIGFYDSYYSNSNSLNDERDFFGTIFTAKKIGEDTYEKIKDYDNYYRVDVKEGQNLTVNLTPHINKDYMGIYLYDKDGSKLDYDSGVHDGETGTVTKISATDGTFFVMIEGAEGKYDLNYIIN